MMSMVRKFGIGVLSLAFLAALALAGNGDQVRQQKRDGSCGNCPQTDCPQYGQGCQGKGPGAGQGQGQGRCQRQRQGQGQRQCPNQGQSPNQGSQDGKQAPAQQQPSGPKGPGYRGGR